MKKSAYKVFAEAFFNGAISKLEMPLINLNTRRLTVDEIKAYLMEEFEKAKDVTKVKTQKDTPWHEAELEDPVDWQKEIKKLAKTVK